MIFITTLAKWFSRTYLHLIMGAWLTNEFIAFELTKAFFNNKDYLIAGSGILLTFVCVYLIYALFKHDPIDAGLIVNEQAINLTSTHTDHFRAYIGLEDFLEQMKHSKLHTTNEKNATNSSSLGLQKLLMKEQAIYNHEEKVLKRWKTVSMLQTLRLNGVM